MDIDETIEITFRAVKMCMLNQLIAPQSLKLTNAIGVKWKCLMKEFGAASAKDGCTTTVLKPPRTK